MKITKHLSTPAHIYADNTAYFISASTWEHRKLLDDECKTRLTELLHEVFDEYSWVLKDWVILDNHYHLLCCSKVGKDMSKMINKIHGLSAQFINTKRNNKDKVWCNYWDYCPRDERDYNTRLCYLLNNPYKHGYVESLHDWFWSSFHQHYQKIGDENLRDLFLEYPDYRKIKLPEACEPT